MSVLVAGLLAASISPTRALTAEVPPRTPDTLLVCSYNIKWLGWRDDVRLDRLAEVLRRFDLCGILEVKEESALADLVAALENDTGKDWGYAFGQRTHRPTGRYYETYGVIWRRDRVQLGDGLISGIWDRHEDFRNDPYLASFIAGDLSFLFVLLHTRWSDDPEGTRFGEVVGMARQLGYLSDFLEETDILLAGDFNYPAEEAAMTMMAEEADLTRLDGDEPTTLGADGYKSPYDHIYASESLAARAVAPAEALDVTTMIYGALGADELSQSKEELSDHLPVFVVLQR